MARPRPRISQDTIDKAWANSMSRKLLSEFEERIEEKPATTRQLRRAEKRTIKKLVEQLHKRAKGVLGHVSRD